MNAARFACAISIFVFLLNSCASAPTAVPPAPPSTLTPIPLPTGTPSPAPTATSTSIPTPTDVPTPTSIPGPTQIPGPSADAMFDYWALEPDPGFKAVSLASVGIDRDRAAFQAEDGKGVFLANGFAFTNADMSQMIWGYSMPLPRKEDTSTFDFIAANLDLVAESRGERNIKLITDLEKLGDVSGAVRGTFTKDGEDWFFQHVAFRTGKIGAFVFMQHKSSIGEPEDVRRWAAVYASSIKTPPPACRLVSVVPDDGAVVPTFKFQAEGFYPGEGRRITLVGNVLVGTETETAMMMKAGLTGEAADEQGRIADEIAFYDTAALQKQHPDAQLPTGPLDFTLTVSGSGSMCEASLVVTWPGLED